MDCDIPSRLTPSSLSRVLLAKKKKKGKHFQKIFFTFFQCGDVEKQKYPGVLETHFLPVT